MSTTIPATHDLPAAVSTESSNAVESLARWMPWLLLITVLLVSVPIVVCMPLTSDTVLFDLQSRIALDGGVLYRDAVEPNFPGVVWIHMAVRSLVGWSSEALRVFDLYVVGLACILLTMSARRGSVQQRCVIALPLLFMAAFYLSRNEWCHCQRDSWMLFPVSIAVWCRLQRCSGDMTNHQSTGRQTVRGHRWWRFSTDSRCLSLFEGIAWGIAAWIKPHVAASLIPVVMYSLMMADGSRRRWMSELFVLSGIVLVVLPGTAWLWKTGAWSWFVEMQLQWNPEYLQAGASRRSLERILQMLVRFHPWWMLHLIAMPAACLDLARAIKARCGRLRDLAPVASNIVSELLAVLYLSWFLQASLVQHAMDYIQVPPVLLAIAFLASRRWTVAIEVRRLAVVLALVLTALSSKQLDFSRLNLWAACLRDGSSPSVRQQLAHGNLPNWADLDQVTRFLKSQEVRQGDVTSWNVHTIHVYQALDLKPSTRFPCVSILKELFPSRSEEILNSVSTCGQQFVVTNRAESQMPPDEFPWNLPIVFKSGQLEVRQATRHMSHFAPRKERSTTP